MKSKDMAAQLQEDRAESQRKFDAEMKQRDQHHEQIVLHHQEMLAMAKMQHEETMIRLKIELEKTAHR